MQLAKADAVLQAAIGALRASGARFRLKDILVEEVSFVDRAANKRRFLVVKHGDSMAEQKESVAKVELPKPVKSVMMRMLTEALERLVSVVNAVKDAEETDAELETPVPAEIGNEIEWIANALLGCLEKYPSPTSKAQVGGNLGPHTHAIPGNGRTGIGAGAGHTHKTPDGKRTGPAMLGGGTGNHVHELPTGGTTGTPDVMKVEAPADALAAFIDMTAEDGGGVSPDALSQLGSETADKMRVLASVLALIADAGSPEELAGMANRMLSVGKALKAAGTASDVLERIAEAAQAVAGEAEDDDTLSAETLVKIRQLAATLNELAEKYPNPAAGAANGEVDMADGTNKSDATNADPKGEAKTAAGAQPEASLDNEGKTAEDATAAKNDAPEPGGNPAGGEGDDDQNEAVAKMAEAVAAGVVSLAKAGRKMSGTRLKKLRLAVSSLSELLSELDDATIVPPGDGQAQKRVAESTPQPPDRAPGDMGNVGQGPVADKRNDKADNEPAIAEVLKRFDMLEAQVKKLSDTPEPPASRADETAGSSRSNGQQPRRKVVW